MSVTNTEQVQYESSVRLRYAAVTFAAGVLLVLSQLLQLTGVHASVSELTVNLIIASQRRTQDIIGAAADTLGIAAAAFALAWLHRIAQARRPELRSAVRYVDYVGGALAAVLAIVYTVVIAARAHDFTSTGNQGYPEAYHLTTGTGMIILPLLLELGSLMLAIGCIWTALSIMRVGLVPRWVGYVGVVAGALFLFPLGAIVPIFQGVFFVAVAVITAGYWTLNDLPAWTTGESVPWQPSQAAQAAAADRRAARQQRGQRRKVSDADVFDAVSKDDQSDAADGDTTSSSLGKRKRRG